MEAIAHTNFSTLNSTVPTTNIHPPLNSFLRGHKTRLSRALALPGPLSQTKLATIVAVTKIISNPFPHSTAYRNL
jgi:hypothetical protein